MDEAAFQREDAAQQGVQRAGEVLQVVLITAGEALDELPPDRQRQQRGVVVGGALRPEAASSPISTELRISPRKLASCRSTALATDAHRLGRRSGTRARASITAVTAKTRLVIVVRALVERIHQRSSANARASAPAAARSAVAPRFAAQSITSRRRSRASGARIDGGRDATRAPRASGEAVESMP